MALSLTESLDNLYTTTWQNMKSDVADQVFDSLPFFFWLRDKGKFKTERGGRFLSEPLQYDKNDNVSWIGKGGSVQLNDYEFLTTARYDWKYLVGSIVRFGVDDQQNRGKNQIINLMNSKMDNTRNALMSELETKLFSGDNSNSEPNAINGLQHLVQDDPTSSTEVGGINQSTYSWWQNQYQDMTGKSFAVHGEKEMRTMLNNCQNNLKMDRPDIIVSGQNPYEYYEDAVQSHHYITNKKLGDAGFDNVQFKGMPMVWSPSCGDRMYFLNTEFFYLTYDPMMWFDMTEWKAIPEQPNDRASQIVSAMSLVTNRRRAQGVLHSIDTA